MKRLLRTLALSIAMILAIASTALGSRVGVTPATAQISPGTLAMSLNPETLQNFGVVDATGTFNGWEVTAVITSPNGCIGTLCESSLELQVAGPGPALACATGSTCTRANDSDVAYPLMLHPQGQVGTDILEATPNSGMGSEVVADFGWVVFDQKLNLSYRSQEDVTLSLSSGPFAEAL